MIVKSNDEQIVMGVVYPSMVSDTDTDFTGPEGNWQAYWNILQKAELPKIDVYHDGNAIDARVVRLFVTLEGDPDFPPNNLVAMVKIGDVNVWADVKKGNFPTVTFRETKTGDSRTNVIGVEVFQAIQRLPRKNELVFNSVRSGTLRTNQINADLKKRAELLGITKPVWSYLFRISYITEMINAGVDWFLLSPIVGHKDPKTTKRYLQLSVNTQAEVITNHPLLKSQITHEQNLKVAKKFFRQAINTESSNLTVRDEGDALWIRIDKKPGQH